MRKIISIICIILIFTLTGCSFGKWSPYKEILKGITEEVLDGVTDPDNSGYKSSKAVPKNLPVYPGAVLWSDSRGYGESEWMWLYDTSGSGNQIVEFFTTELNKLGLKVDEEKALAFRETFFVMTEDYVVQVFWLGDDHIDENTNEDTPNRGYGIIVNLDKWNK